MATSHPITSTDISATRISELVDRYPRLMELLAPLGIDLCCGGAHPLGEALDLHNIPREPTLSQAAELIQRDAA